MIEFGTIEIKSESSIIASRNKVMMLAEDCGLDTIGCVRLATVTSEICRRLHENDSSTKLVLCLVEKENRCSLVLLFSGSIESLTPVKLLPFFDNIDLLTGEDGTQQLEVSRLLDPGFTPTEEFTESVRARIIQQSAAELFEELEKKNDELSGLLDERKIVIQELEEKTHALETATRLKSEFLANMSHELRTPLNSIIGFTSRVVKKAGEQLPEKQLKNLHTVSRNAQHLLGLINSLLDISKIEAGKMDTFIEEFRLGPLVAEVLELTRSLVGEKDLRLIDSLPTNQITFYTDRSKLKQILINLVSNSIKFTESGSITVSARKCEKDLSDKDTFLKPDTDYFTLSVTDTGIGLDEDEKHIVFEAFRQVDGSLTRKEGGTGLGLAITQKFTELLQGRVEIESSKGIGTTFSITLPVQMAGHKVEKHEVEERAELPVSPGQPTVLCIDDDPDVRELLRGYLTDEGFNVVTAHDGIEGLQKAVELQPLAITLDIQMPTKDGWTVLSELKSSAVTKEIPVIIVSITDNRSLGFGLGAFDYLQKPILPEVLMPAMDKILRRKAKTILSVDDDPEVHGLLEQILKEENIKLSIAVNGKEALEALNKEIPDLILLDLMMPVMDGFETSRRIKEKAEWADIPIVVITAKSLSEAERDFLKNRVEAIVTKDGLSSKVVLREISTVIKKIKRA